jgi:hypothetical protein
MISLLTEIADDFASYLPRKNHRETDSVRRVVEGLLEEDKDV